MSTRPPILDELGRELVGAARAQEARGPRAGRVGRLPRAVVVGLLALLGLAAVAAAASLIIGRGDAIPAPHPGVVPIELRPVAGSARLNGLDVRDPDGGPAWDVRTSRGTTGAICATVGQVLDGELGLLGLDRRFRVLPAGAADTCSRPRSSGATLAGARAFRGGGRLGALTVVSGVAAPSVRGAIVTAGGRTMRMRLGTEHAFLAVLRGRPEDLRPRVVLTEASGARTTLRFADSGEFISADPSGRAPWKLQYSRGRKGLRCVHAQREPVSDWPNATSVPKRCGPPTAPFVAIRRFVPRLGPLHPAGRPSQINHDPTLRWVHPARTVVWGWTPRSAGEVLFTGAGAPRRLPVDRRSAKGRTERLRGPSVGRGGFLAVLDGRVDPRRLRVSVGGRRLDPARSVGPSGRRVGRETVPAWRSVASYFGLGRPRATFRAVPGSASISRRAKDPAGGPGWALRTWTARIVATPGHGPDRRRRCFTFGVEDGDRLVEPLPGNGRRTVRMSGRDRVCPMPAELKQGSIHPEVRAYVDDAEAPDPRPVRVVVAGMLGDRARTAKLLGAGGERDLALGRHGTFLAVLGPEHVQARLRVRVVDADGLKLTSRPIVFSRCVPIAGQSVRVADPDGGPSWTTGIGRVGERYCHYVGRGVGERVASLSDASNWIIFAIPVARPWTTLRPWLYTIVRNRALDRLRSHRDAGWFDDEVQRPARMTALDPVADLAAREELRTIVTATGGCPSASEPRSSCARSTAARTSRPHKPCTRPSRRRSRWSYARARTSKPRCERRDTRDPPPPGMPTNHNVRQAKGVTMVSTRCAIQTTTARVSTPRTARRSVMKRLPGVRRRLVIALVGLAALSATILPATVQERAMHNEIVLAGGDADPLPGVFHWGVRGPN